MENAGIIVALSLGDGSPADRYNIDDDIKEVW